MYPMYDERNNPIYASDVVDFSDLAGFESIDYMGRIYLMGGWLRHNKGRTLKMCSILDERSGLLEPCADMHYARYGHSLIGWRSRYIIAVGSLSRDTYPNAPKVERTCEFYNIAKDHWRKLPDFKFVSNSYTFKPSLTIVKDRYLYKFSGTRCCQLETLDLHQPKEWR
jgi:hypothetical protein